MGAKPIPKKLLIHSIEYREYTGNIDGWGGEFAAPVTINNVRVDPITALTRTNIRDDVEASSIIFIDRTFSSPYIEMKERSKVFFEGKEYEVTKVNPLYDDQSVPHHYENEVK